MEEKDIEIGKQYYFMNYNFKMNSALRNGKWDGVLSYPITGLLLSETLERKMETDEYLAYGFINHNLMVRSEDIFETEIEALDELFRRLNKLLGATKSLIDKKIGRYND